MVDFIGPGKTGKSTVVDKVVQRFYESVNIGIISNKIEAQFGLGGVLFDREIFVTLSGELDKDCQLGTTEMLQICSGDAMTCAVKNNKSPIQISHWPTHWMSAQNEFPAIWKDKTGEVLRRHLQFRFMRRVRATISDLPQQLEFRGHRSFH